MGQNKQADPTSSASNKNTGSNENDEQTSKSSEGPDLESSSHGKSVTIETADEVECQKLIANILSKRGTSVEDVVIEYKGNESIEELIPSLFNFPSEKDKEEIKKIQKHAEGQSGQDFVTVKNVIISEPYDDDMQHVEKVDQTIGDLPQTEAETDEVMYKQLVEQLPTVEGFDTEEWGAAVNTKSDSMFYKVSNPETDDNIDNEDTNDFLEELMNCSSCSDKTVLLEKNEPAQSDILKTGHCDGDKNDNLEQLDDSMLMTEPGDNEFDGTDFPYEGEFDLDMGLGRLPEDIITPSFVLDFVLNSTTSPPTDEIPQLGGISETETEDMKNQLDASKKENSETEMDVDVGNCCDNNDKELQQNEQKAQPSAEIAKANILHATTKKIDGQVTNIASTDTDNPAGSEFSPVVNADLKSTNAVNSRYRIKPCVVLLKRIDTDTPMHSNNELNPTRPTNSTNSNNHSTEISSSKLTESNNTTPVQAKDKVMKPSNDNRYGSLVSKIAGRLLALKSRKHSTEQSAPVELEKDDDDDPHEGTGDFPERGPERVQSVISKVDDVEKAEFPASSSYNLQSEAQSAHPKQQSCTDSAKKKVAIVPDNGQSQNVLKACVEDTAANSVNTPDDKDKVPSCLQNVETPKTKNVRSGLRRKSGSQPHPGPSKRTKSSPQTGQSQKSLLNLMTNECLKPNPDVIILSDALAKTFSGRQKFMEDPEVDVVQMIDRYPALALYPMVKLEFGRTLGDIDKMVQLEQKLRVNLFEALSLKKKPFRKRHHLWEESAKCWSDNKNCDERKKLVLGMVALCFHFVENAVVTNLWKILEKNERLQPHEQLDLITPRLVFNKSQLFETDTEMWIHTEANPYLKVPNIYEGVLCIYATYYIYNMKYDRKLQPLFEYFDYVIGIPQNTFTDTSNAFSVKK